MTKALENKEMRLWNNNKRIANYAHSFQSKSVKPYEQKKRRRIEKGFNNEGDKKKQEVRKCKIYGKKHLKDWWHLNTECYIYHNMRYIAVKCLKKSSNYSFSSWNKKKLYYTYKVINYYFVSKTKVD